MGALSRDEESSKRTLLTRFFGWYERHYLLNLTLAACLFTLQLIHLYWLGMDVIAERLTGTSYFNPSPLWEYLIIIVDYTEIPALLTTTVLYIFELRQKFLWRYVFYLVFLNSQWLHLFWITDEFVVNQFAGRPSTILPGWLAWIAILIDYLELPVIIDTLKKLAHTVRREGWAGIRASLFS